MPEIVEAGLVKVEAMPDGWYHVMIGRARKVKNIYLRDSEARQLVEQLQALLSE